MYLVKCKNCGKEYQSGSNREGICPDCKKNVRGKNNTRYRDRTYDRITLYVPKGFRQPLKEYTLEHGMSVNEFINNAIGLYIEKIETEKSKHGSDISGGEAANANNEAVDANNESAGVNEYNNIEFIHFDDSGVPF